MKAIVLSNTDISLREFREADWKAVHAYAAKDFVSRYQVWGPNTEADSRDYVSQAIKDSHKAHRQRFALAIVKSGKVVGAIELNIRSQQNKIGEIGYIVHPDYWGQGIATASSRLLLGFGFEKLKLHRIFATCDPENKASAKVIEKIGMVKEGTLRENMKLNDRWRDSSMYSMLENEWKRH